MEIHSSKSGDRGGGVDAQISQLLQIQLGTNLGRVGPHLPCRQPVKTVFALFLQQKVQQTQNAAHCSTVNSYLLKTVSVFFYQAIT